MKLNKMGRVSLCGDVFQMGGFRWQNMFMLDFFAKIVAQSMLLVFGFYLFDLFWDVYYPDATSQPFLWRK